MNIHIISIIRVRLAALREAPRARVDGAPRIRALLNGTTNTDRDNDDNCCCCYYCYYYY